MNLNRGIDDSPAHDALVWLMVLAPAKYDESTSFMDFGEGGLVHVPKELHKPFAEAEWIIETDF